MLMDNGYSSDESWSGGLTKQSRLRSEMSGNDETYLSPDYAPGESDVICSRGSISYHHAANTQLREMIDDCLDGYKNATNKIERSAIVSSIIHKVHGKKGSFVRQDPKTKRWFRVDTRTTREKVGQAIRAALKKKEQYVFRFSQARSKVEQMKKGASFVAQDQERAGVEGEIARESPQTRGNRGIGSGPATRCDSVSSSTSLPLQGLRSFPSDTTAFTRASNPRIIQTHDSVLSSAERFPLFWPALASQNTYFRNSFQGIADLEQPHILRHNNPFGIGLRHSEVALAPGHGLSTPPVLQSLGVAAVPSWAEAMQATSSPYNILQLQNRSLVRLPEAVMMPRPFHLHLPSSLVASTTYSVAMPVSDSHILPGIENLARSRESNPFAQVMESGIPGDAERSMQMDRRSLLAATPLPPTSAHHLAPMAHFQHSDGLSHYGSVRSREDSSSAS